jgi:hypothetical protein
VPSSFVKATREQNRLRMLLTGPPGSGKTWTGLTFAQRLRLALGTGPDVPIALIDSEHGRSTKYQGDRPTPDAPPLDFDVCVLKDYSPATYTSKVEEAGRDGYGVLIIDSLAHAWGGPGGVLDLHDAMGGNRFTNWSKVNPIHYRLFEAILESPCHIIATCRAKVKHVVEDNKPRKIGLGIVQRPGTEYEFDVVGSMDRSHVLTIEKSLCHEIENAVVACPTGPFLDPVIAWLQTGKAGPVTAAKRRLLNDEQLQTLVRLAADSGEDRGRTEADLLRKYGVREFADLKPDQAAAEIARRQRLEPARKPAAVTVPVAVPAPPPPGITDEQVHRINELTKALEAYDLTRDDFNAALAKRGAKKLADLTEAAAAALIDRLSPRLVAAELAAQIRADEKTKEMGVPVLSGVEKRALEDGEAADGAAP